MPSVAVSSLAPTSTSTSMSASAVLAAVAVTVNSVDPAPSSTLVGLTDKEIAIPSSLPMARLVPVTVCGELLPVIETDSSPS